MIAIPLMNWFHVKIKIGQSQTTMWKMRYSLWPKIFLDQLFSTLYI